MWKPGKLVAGVALGAAVAAGVLEGVPRLLPERIPPMLLQHFEEGLRQSVLATTDPLDAGGSVTVERDDGGPLLRKRRARERVVLDHGDAGATALIVTDDLGYCNPPKNRYGRDRIDLLAIGDSLTWCTTVAPEQTWPALLGDDLGLAAYNLGFPGIGLYEYLVLLRRYGLAKSPRVVVLNFYEGNDLRDALRYWRHRRRGAGSTDGGWLARWSFAYNLARAAWGEWLAPAGEGPAVPEKSGLEFRYSLDFGDRRVRFNLRNADRDELAHAIALAEGRLPLDVFDSAFAEFRRLADAHGFRPLVVYSPSAHTAYADHVAFDDASVAPLMQAYSARLRAAVAGLAERFGFAYVDLTPRLWAEIARQGAARPDQLLYYPGSVHYSVEGHRVVARELVEVLRGLLAEPGHESTR